MFSIPLFHSLINVAYGICFLSGYMLSSIPVLLFPNLLDSCLVGLQCVNNMNDVYQSNLCTLPAIYFNGVSNLLLMMEKKYFSYGYSKS